MARNVELLTKVRDLVKAEPTKLNMGLWAAIPYDLVELDSGGQAKVSCGTTGCIAGWAVQLAGDKLLVRSSDSEGDVYYVANSVAKNGRVCGIEDRARKLLGLTSREANYLFVRSDDVVVGLLDRLIAGEDIFPVGR